ncbi:unnamed protein product [Didymodactylos carnosus]|uniref:Uncharacterized protein n=1 Tax=Didymodactylos carnosus TaxID=1234261 RepID=A0A8S2HCY4_9BILA|nr:unnamed protein product [Didymodactylos carnosus]CAF3625781.1 unnamed protein product [Didymodactylos carnosus]
MGELDFFVRDVESLLRKLDRSVVEYEDHCFVEPTTTIRNFIESGSLVNKLKSSCELNYVNIEEIKMTPTVFPDFNINSTVKEWYDEFNGEVKVMFGFKDDSIFRFQNKKNVIQEQVDIEVASQIAKMNVKPSCTTEMEEQFEILKKQIEQLQNVSSEQSKTQAEIIIEQAATISSQTETLNDIKMTLSKQDTSICEMKRNEREMKKTLSENSQCIKVLRQYNFTLIRLHQRILIEKFRLYLAKKYPEIFYEACDLAVNDSTSYREISPQISTFLNALEHSNKITSPIEKQCFQFVHSNRGGEYYYISETYVHDASQQTIADSVLRARKKHRNTYIEMYRLVYNQEPQFLDDADQEVLSFVDDLEDS